MIQFWAYRRDVAGSGCTYDDSVACAYQGGHSCVWRDFTTGRLRKLDHIVTAPRLT